MRSINQIFRHSRLYIKTACGHASRAKIMPQRPLGHDMNQTQMNVRSVFPKNTYFSFSAQHNF